jgi:hypothetical protein
VSIFFFNPHIFCLNNTERENFFSGIIENCKQNRLHANCISHWAIPFFFYSHEPNEPPHVHIDREKCSAKFWLKKVSLANNLGFAKKEINYLDDLMNILASKTDERVEAVYFTRDSLVVDLVDGRTISVPLHWYPKLLKATPKQRAIWEICGGGYGIHWPEIDEDLSTEGLLRGAPAPKGCSKTKPKTKGRTRAKILS